MSKNFKNLNFVFYLSNKSERDENQIVAYIHIVKNSVNLLWWRSAPVYGTSLSVNRQRTGETEPTYDNIS